MSELPENAHELDVRVIPHAQRHMLIFAELEKLGLGESLVIKNDHNPVPLRMQVDALYSSQFEWKYLDEGPEVFRLCFTRVQEEGDALEIDVRIIPHAQCHMLIFSELEKLAVGKSLIIKVDHNPVPLRMQVEGLYGPQFEWEYLEEGPEIFRLRFTRKQDGENAHPSNPGSTFKSTIPVRS